MNEITLKNNKDNLVEDIENIKIELQKSIKKIDLIKDSYQKEQQDDYENSYHEDSKIKINIRYKKGRFNYHVNIFIPVLQFLDINSILELSRVNHLFHSFIFSIYFYRSINQLITKSKKNSIKYKKEIPSSKTKNNNKKTQTKEEENIILGQSKKLYSSFMSALAGAFNYLNPTIETKPIPKTPKNELEEIQQKIELHEKVIDQRIKQIKLTEEINNIKKGIEINIKVKYKNKKIKDEIKLNEYSNKKKEKEKYEMEYNSLIKEINEIEKEYDKIKKDNEQQYQMGINLDDKINKIKYYENNLIQNNKSE